jgi:hypothetical protein
MKILKSTAIKGILLAGLQAALFETIKTVIRKAK